MVATGVYEPRGAAYELFFDDYPEVLIEGPAGTGKTRAVLEKINYWCQEVPGIRAFISRATRVSMTESVLVEFEDSVLDPTLGVKMLGGGRSNRTAYHYPNGSYITVAGLDNSDRIMSSQYDLAAVFEATEITESDWDKIQSRMRHGRLWFQQSIADCNPSFRSHWLNRRADRIGKNGRPLMRRLLSKHEDNPRVTKEYLTRLDNLSGARHGRLRLGLWIDESGLVLPEYDEQIHLVPESRLRYADGSHRCTYYVGGIDWGWRNPGCFQVWGVTRDNEMYRVEEVYFRNKRLDWWADVVEQAYRQYDLQNVVCDPAQPEHIAMLNDRLTYRGGRNVGGIAVPANNKWQVGRDLVAELLRPTDGSKPRLFLVRDAHAMRGLDEGLVSEHLPATSEEEIPGLTWDEAKEDKPIKERPKPGVPDHAFDVMRYVAMFLWGKDSASRPTNQVLPPGSIGAILGWEKDL